MIECDQRAQSIAMIRFPFRERKAAQAAHYLLRVKKGPMTRLRLIKLLYLADRRSLVETGMPITGDAMYSMRKGPILSCIYDAIKGKTNLAAWDQYMVSRYSYVIPRPDQPTPQSLAEYDELSRYDVRILTETLLKYAHLTTYQLVDLLHAELPEWKDPGDSSAPIDPADILKAEGKTADEIRIIAQEAKSSLEFRVAVGQAH